jgi:hypothetical protein
MLMTQLRARNHEMNEFWRSLPALLTALLVVVMSVDILLTLQPAWLEELSRAWQRMIAVRPMAAPVPNVLAASISVSSVVIASALLRSFSRAVQLAPYATLGPAWVALWTLAMLRIETPMPLPMSLPLFIALSALLIVGAGVALCSGSQAGILFGWVLLLSPLATFAGCVAIASRTHPAWFQAAQALRSGAERDAMLVLGGLLVSALGMALLSVMSLRTRRIRNVEGLEGIDVVDELFAQLERAERSEARCAELEQQLANARKRGSAAVLESTLRVER